MVVMHNFYIKANSRRSKWAFYCIQRHGGSYPKERVLYKPKITPKRLSVLVCVGNRNLDLEPCLGSPKCRTNSKGTHKKTSTNFCNNWISHSVYWEVLYCAVIGQIKMASAAVTTEFLLFYESANSWDLGNLGVGSTERLREATGCYPRSWDT